VIIAHKVVSIEEEGEEEEEEEKSCFSLLVVFDLSNSNTMSGVTRFSLLLIVGELK
jgi:hypothetical protein